MAGFYIFKDNAAEWRWRFRAEGNNSIIATSGEGYNNLTDCEHAIALLKAQAPTGEISGDADYTAVRGVSLLRSGR
jgi:uncharacterized protein YegP (UPF0339 family)